MTTITRTKIEGTNRLYIKQDTNKPLKRRRGYCHVYLITIFAIGYCAAYFSLSSNSKDVLPKGSKYEKENGNILTSVQPPIVAVTGSLLQESRVKEIRKMAFSITRVYQPSPPSTWCVDNRLRLDQLKQRPMGLCYLNIPRSASTTLKAINMRIARNFALRHKIDGCIRHDSNTRGIYYSKRDKLSYLWTFVREPTHRALSVIGNKLSYQILRSNHINGDSLNSMKNGTVSSLPLNETSNIDYVSFENVLVNRSMNMLKHATNLNNGVRSEGRGGFQLQFGMQHYIDMNSAVDPENPTIIKNPHNVLGHVAYMFNRYDFVGVLDRFDESLVVLQLLLGLESSDILYFAANMKNQWQRGKNDRCVKTLDWEADILTLPKINEYVTKNPEWYAQNYGDHLLYQAANRSLDRTILQIGLEYFVAELKKFKNLLKRANDVCKPKFPCSSEGQVQFNVSRYDCIDGKLACGYKCLDSLT